MLQQMLALRHVGHVLTLALLLLLLLLLLLRCTIRHGSRIAPYLHSNS